MRKLVRESLFNVKDIERESLFNISDAKNELMLEALADLEHDRWSHWQGYMHSLCEKNEDGSLTIPAEKVERWERQINTKYKDLTEKEKDSDRDEARKTMKIIKRYE